MRPAPWVLATLVLLLAGCGGGDATWCFSSGPGAVAAGSDFERCQPGSDPVTPPDAP